MLKESRGRVRKEMEKRRKDRGREGERNERRIEGEG